MISVDVKNHVYLKSNAAEFKRCVKVKVAVLGSPSLISLTVSVDVKHHVRKKERDNGHQSSEAV